MAALTSEAAKTHLIVLVHGYDGTSADWTNAARYLEGALPDALVLRCTANSGWLATHDGIEAGAARLCDEICSFADGHAGLCNLTVLAHSLGGLYARACLPLLAEAGLYERLLPRSFVSFASPHLGIRRPQTTPLNRVFSLFAKRLSKTTSELSLEDGGRGDGAQQPLLYRIATEARYLDALRRFERRVAYANVFNDLQVPYSTASIRRRNPYRRQHVSGDAAPPSPRGALASDAKVVVEAAPLEPDATYPRLTAWSVTNAARRLSRGLSAEAASSDSALEFERHSVGEDGMRSSFSKEREGMQTMLRAMLVSLDGLEWQRYDTVFGTQFAHIQIVCKIRMLGSLDPLRHCVDTVLLPGWTAEVEAEQESAKSSL